MHKSQSPKNNVRISISRQHQPQACCRRPLFTKPFFKWCLPLQHASPAVVLAVPPLTSFLNSSFLSGASAIQHHLTTHVDEELDALIFPSSLKTVLHRVLRQRQLTSALKHLETLFKRQPQGMGGRELKFSLSLSMSPPLLLLNARWQLGFPVLNTPGPPPFLKID